MTTAGRTPPIHGTGEVADLIRNFNWASSTLGALETWPETLLVAVNMILAAPIPMQLFWGPDFICIYNDAMTPALSNKHPFSLGRSAREVWSEAWDTIGPQLKQVLAGGEAVSFADALVPLLREDVLEDQYWTYSYSALRDPQGHVVGVLDVAQNTSVAVLSRQELERTQQVAARNESRFRLLIDRASVGVAIGDTHGGLSYLNRALLDLLGFTTAEVAAGEVRWDEMTPEKYAEADRQAIRELREHGVARPYEKHYRAKDGRLVPIQVGAIMIPAVSLDAAEDDVAVFFTDLSFQKKAEAALLQAEKVGAVGKLASAISHEINNPLEAITNIFYIVRNLPDLPQSAADYLRIADRELARVSQVAAQTLSFHRLSTRAMSVVPDVMMEEVLQLYASRLENYKIVLQREYAADLSLSCFEGDIRQVLNNLVDNALSFMRNGGSLTLRTRQATRWSDGTQGIRITIADTGGGIPPEVQGRLFDAFFTTKGIHGTGLGLWISCRIVHKHRGYVRARNRIGLVRGAVFQLWLPVALAPSAHEPWHILTGETAFPYTS